MKISIINIRTILRTVVILFSCMATSCTKTPLNEVDGSYYYKKNMRVIFNDSGVISKDQAGNLYITCYGYTEPETEENTREGITVLIPEKCYSQDRQQISFRKDFDSRVALFSQIFDDLFTVHLREETKVHITGSVSNNLATNFFEEERNEYPCSISLSFSLDDGTKIRLQINRVTITKSDSFSPLFI